MSLNKLLNKLIIFLIFIYQKIISPLLGPRCRYYPTCSSYCTTCFQRFSFCRALWYSYKRIIRCHPFSSGGIDLPPEK